MSEKKNIITRKHSGKSVDTAIIDKAMRLYFEDKSLNSISKIVGIARSTLARYRESEKWDVRKAEQKKRIAEKVDAQIVSEKSRQLTYARFMANRGANRMRTLTDADISARDSIAMIREGILLERAILGEGEQTIEIKIKLPAGLENM